MRYIYYSPAPIAGKGRETKSVQTHLFLDCCYSTCCIYMMRSVNEFSYFGKYKRVRRLSGSYNTLIGTWAAILKNKHVTPTWWFFSNNLFVASDNSL